MTRTGRPRTAERTRHVCEQCGTEFERAAWEKTSGRFCSKVCYWASKTGKRPEGFIDTRGVPRIEHVTKPCRNCGEPFWVKGVVRRSQQVFCSAKCAGIGKHAEPRRLSETDAAYIAGFFDGEGTLQEVKPGTWRVTIYQCNEEVIRWIAEVTGTGLVASRKPNGGNLVKQSAFKTGWIWQLYGRNAALFLWQIRPYMHVKAEKAELMLADYDFTIEEVLSYEPGFDPTKETVITWDGSDRRVVVPAR